MSGAEEEHGLPQAIDAEEAVLGALLLDPNVIGTVGSALKPESFYGSAHQELYRAILLVRDNGQEVNFTTVRACLEETGKLEKVGGTQRIAYLLEACSHTSIAPKAAEMVANRAMLRRLILDCQAIARQASEPQASVTELLDRMQARAAAISLDGPQRWLHHASSDLEALLSDAEARRDGRAPEGIPSGFYDLDTLTQGFQRGDLVILAARPAMGKTALALNAAYNVARVGHPVVIVSLEMSGPQLMARVLAIDTSVSPGALRSGKTSDEDWVHVRDGQVRLKDHPLWISDRGSATVGEVRTHCQQLAQAVNRKLGLVVIDYLQLMDAAAGKGSENRTQELSRITRALKGLARDLDVPVLALSQLSRAVEQRSNKRPMLSDLRESGCLTGDTLITLADCGTQISIRNLIGRDSGFRVMALNTETLRIEAAEVSNAFSTGVKPVFMLRTASGREVRATANHPFLTVGGWRRLDQLRIGADRIAIPRHLPDMGSRRTMSSSEMRFLGHMIGDGCTLDHHVIQYTTGDEDLAVAMVNMVAEVFGDAVRPRISREGNWWQVYMPACGTTARGACNPIAAWLDGMGAWGWRSHQKRIPPEALDQPDQRIAELLRGLWSTDGCLSMCQGKSVRPVARFSSSSPVLSRQVQSLLMRLGVSGVLREVPQGRSGRAQHSVTITGRADILQFLDRVGVDGYRRQAVAAQMREHYAAVAGNTNRDVIPADVWDLHALPALAASPMTHRQFQRKVQGSYCGSTLYRQNLSRERAATVAAALDCEPLRRIAESDVFWDPVVSIEPDGEEEVFDMTVPGHHNFIANDIFVHNSIEQDADLVVFLYRDEYYNPDTADKGLAEVILSKHRNGPIGTVKLLFEPQFTRFRNAASWGAP